MLYQLCWQCPFIFRLLQKECDDMGLAEIVSPQGAVEICLKAFPHIKMTLGEIFEGVD